MAISGRYRRSLLDTRATKGPDVRGHYHFVIAKKRLKLTRYKAAEAGKELTYRFSEALKSKGRESICTGNKEQISVPTDH